ncbi:8260_t:CDS:2, partial [Cetraspora pellucida]
RKQYIHALVDESSKSYTASFNASEIKKVLNLISFKKFVAVVSDTESAICIAHHINLITSHIIKLDFAKGVFKKCQILISFFKNSYHAGAALQEDIVNSFIKDGGLKTLVKTRWSTAWNCCNSIIRLENSLKNIN